MRILTALTYYRPHISGLTIYTERLTKALANRGHEVTVLTSQFDPQTALEERQDGVYVRRVPVLFRISKGVIMPTIGIHATNLVKNNDVVHLHLPQFDAVLRPFQSRTTVTTSHGSRGSHESHGNRESRENRESHENHENHENHGSHGNHGNNGRS